MKTASIVLIVLGLLLTCLHFIYGHASNVADSSDSGAITTLNGAWSVELPVFFGGVMLVFGFIFYYIAATDDKPELSKY